MEPLFLVEEKQSVCRVRLNRPEIHNAFNDQMIKEMTEFFHSFHDKPEIRLVVLEGEGKSFCAGADLNWMKRMKNYSDEENYQDSVRLQLLFESINMCPVPVIAKVHGAVLGGGTGIISCCDFVLSSHDTMYGFTEVALGLLPAVISPYVMAKIGETNARAYFMSGERFDAETALRIGLIHRVCDHSELDEKLETIKKIFLKAGPVASREAKKLIRGVLTLNDQKEEVRDFTCRTISRIRTSEEGQEGMTALLQKRKPNWILKG